MPKQPREKLRKARRRARLSQQALADLAGVHRVTLANYELGSIEPAVGHALNLARALGTSVEALFADEPNHEPRSSR